MSEIPTKVERFIRGALLGSERPPSAAETRAAAEYLLATIASQLRTDPRFVLSRRANGNGKRGAPSKKNERSKHFWQIEMARLAGETVADAISQTFPGSDPSAEVCRARYREIYDKGSYARERSKARKSAERIKPTMDGLIEFYAEHKRLRPDFDDWMKSNNYGDLPLFEAISRYDGSVDG